MFHKTKNKNKKYFCRSCLQCFSVWKILTEHKQVCLSINGSQSVWLEKGKTKFKNYFKQLAVLFKIYTDFESNLESAESYEGSYLTQKNIKVTFLVVLLTNLFVLRISLVSRLLFLKAKMLLLILLRQFLKSMNTAKKWQKITLTKNWSWVKKKKNNFTQVTCVGYVKNSLMMTIKKLGIII